MSAVLACYFAKCGFEVTRVASVLEAKRRFAQRSSWALVLAEYNLPDGTGVDLYRWIRSRTIRAPAILLMSGGHLAHTLASPITILAKPFSLEELNRHVATLLRQSAN